MPNAVKSKGTYNRTYTSTTQLMRVTVNGYFGRSTSSRRYKLNEKIIKLSYARKILELNAVSWYDKRQSEKHAEYLTNLENGIIGEDSEEPITRIGGIIAEDTYDAGLEMYVNLDEEGRPEGVSEKLWTLLIPITKNHDERLEILEVFHEENKYLKDTVESHRKTIENLQKDVYKIKENAV